MSDIPVVHKKCKVYSFWAAVQYTLHTEQASFMIILCATDNLAPIMKYFRLKSKSLITYKFFICHKHRTEISCT